VAGKRRLGSSSFISRRETLEQLPGIKKENLLGGVLYHDGQFDDARLAINLAQTIWDKGGFAINYMSVKGLLKDDQQKISGVIAEDLESGKRITYRQKRW
jgi:glycerol-3-phosphate dehydrogenase